MGSRELERRRAKRVRRRLRVTLRTTAGALGGVCRNLSARGLAVEVSAPLPSGTRLVCRLLLPHGPDLEVEATVRWSRPLGPAGHGAVLGLALVGRPDDRFTTLVRQEIDQLQARSTAALEDPAASTPTSKPAARRRRGIPSPPNLAPARAATSPAPSRSRSSGKSKRVLTPSRPRPADPLAGIAVGLDGLASATASGTRLEMLEVAALARQAALRVFDGILPPERLHCSSLDIELLRHDVAPFATLAAVARLVEVDREQGRFGLQAQVSQGRRVVARGRVELEVLGR